jgi:hypothetical protein
VSMFAVFGRRQASDPTTGMDILDIPTVPRGFEALGETLVAGGNVTFVCSEIGRGLGADGAALSDVLEGMAETYRRVDGGEPPFAAVSALTLSWSEAALQYLHALSCEDPLTGLASLTHLRSRLAEVYRAESVRNTPPGTTHALVVVELVDRAGALHRAAIAFARFDRVLRLTDAAECLRLVYSGGETIGQAGHRRAVAIVARDQRLADSIPVLRRLLTDWHRERGRAVPRVWIEGLPSSQVAASRLLDELAR